MLRLIFFLSLIAITGCTTIGLPNHLKAEKMDFGEHATMRMCVLKERNISQERVDNIIQALRKEFAQYNIGIDVPWVRTWDRPGFTYEPILSDIIQTPLQPPCDRIFAFVNRNIGDFLWGLIMPEILGSVEGQTHTKGFSVAEMGSLNQLLGIATPESNAIHETYHLLGCGHNLIMNKCYDRIKELKRIAIIERAAGNDFFPALTVDGKTFKTRTEVQNEFYQTFRNLNNLQ